jgi:cytochrome c oxidase cbb3-type subunit III
MRTHKQTWLLFVVNACLITAVLAMAGCKSPPQAVASSALAVTHVGPVPGGQGTPIGQTNPYEGNPVALQDGRRLFDWYNCSGCHGGHAGGGMGPSLRDKIWLYGDSDAQIFNSIASGRSQGMPSWGSKIPQDQIWQLVAYIKSLRTPAEPDPPVMPPNEQIPNPSNNTHLGVGPHQH